MQRRPARPGSGGLQLALVEALPVVGQAAVDRSDSLAPTRSAGATRSSSWGPDSLRLAGSRRILPCSPTASRSLTAEASIALARSTAVLQAAEATGPAGVMAAGPRGAGETAAGLLPTRP